MQSSVPTSASSFFTFEALQELATSIKTPLVAGRVWPNDERNPSWTIECESFEEFCLSVKDLRSKIEFLAFDESILDDEVLQNVHDELTHYAEEEGLSTAMIPKAMSALRSHENELVAVLAYAFLRSGQVILARSQGELARFVYSPHRLLSADGLAHVRKLRTLADQG